MIAQKIMLLEKLVVKYSLAKIRIFNNYVMPGKGCILCKRIFLHKRNLFALKIPPGTM